VDDEERARDADEQEADQQVRAANEIVLAAHPATTDHASNPVQHSWLTAIRCESKWKH
jgi:hypothetical protein